MADFINILSMLLIASPVVIGFAAFAGLWLQEEFYTDPFYDDYE